TISRHPERSRGIPSKVPSSSRNGIGVASASSRCPEEFIGRMPMPLSLGMTTASLQDQSTAQNSFRSHDLTEFLEIFLHRFADDGVTVIAPVLHFARGGFQARFDL